jgi:hypothetical protein
VDHTFSTHRKTCKHIFILTCQSLQLPPFPWVQPRPTDKLGDSLEPIFSSITCSSKSNLLVPLNTLDLSNNFLMELNLLGSCWSAIGPVGDHPPALHQPSETKTVMQFKKLNICLSFKYFPTTNIIRNIRLPQPNIKYEEQPCMAGNKQLMMPWSLQADFETLGQQQ